MHNSILAFLNEKIDCGWIQSDQNIIQITWKKVRKLAFVSDIKYEVFPRVFFADLEYLDGYEGRQKAKIVHTIRFQIFLIYK